MTLSGARLRHEGAVVAVLAFAWLACSAGWRDLALPDEGRYVGVAWEMLSGTHWTVPTLDGLPFFHKPPLFYWITAAALGAFGRHPWAARLASVLGATLAVWALYAFTRRWSGVRTARIAALVLATQPFFFVGAQFANLDMLVAALITASVLLAAQAALDDGDGAPQQAALVGAYVMAALAVLAKGLIGIVLPALVVAAWLAAERRVRTLLRMISLPGLLLFSLIAMPWFFAVEMHNAGFLEYFFVHHHFQRFSQSGFNNENPFWFYVPVVLGLTLPWSAALVLLRRAPVPAPPPTASLRRLMWIWLAVVVVFFSIPRSKLVGYVLPALPPLAWLLADAIARWRPLTQARGLKALGAGAALVCVAAVALIARHDSGSTRPLAQALARQPAVDAPIVYVRRYAYDFAFYAGWDGPLYLLDDWSRADIAAHDDWHREIVEAARFDPATAQRRLVEPAALAALRCAHAALWLVASPAAVAAEPALHGAHPVAAGRDASLWRLDRPACAPDGG